MSVLAYSPEWAIQFQDAINQSAAYRQAAATWEGSIGLVVLADAERNFPSDAGIWLDLWHGQARRVGIVGEAEARHADYVISAPYAVWKDVAQGRLDAIKGLMLGRLRLRGNLMNLVRYTKAAKELTLCTSRIDVIWPDEVKSGV